MMKNKQFKQLATMCMSDTVPAQYLDKGNCTVSPDRYLFIDNGADILAVCHWDTVSRTHNSYKFMYGDRKDKIIGIQTIQLDDRLGAFIILNMLPKFGVKCDVLITTDEEIGNSTAQFFDASKYGKKYNWIFSFDRRGIFPVLYEYDSNTDWLNSIRTVTDTTYGSFSDISYLNGLGICGVNWGTGYYDEHTNKCYALESSINICVESFVEFYMIFKNVKFDYVPTAYTATRYNWYAPTTSKKISANQSVVCDYCGELRKGKDMRYDKYYSHICETCFNDLESSRYEKTFDALDETNEEYCDCCGQLYSKDNMTYSNITRSYICADCLDTQLMDDLGIGLSEDIADIWRGNRLGCGG